MESTNLFAAHYWRYSLSAYAQAGVQTLCLQLQDDYQANVSLLLLGGFIGSSEQELTADDWRYIDAAQARFSQRYTQRIRRLRERAQQFASWHITASECYRQVKSLELKAEQLGQKIIAVSCNSSLRSRLPGYQGCVSNNQVLHNLLTYYATWPSTSTTAVEVLHELAVALRQKSETKRSHSQR